MPKDMPIRQNQPTIMEKGTKLGIIRQADSPRPFINDLASGHTLLPGDPIEKGGYLGIAHAVVYPGQVGEMWHEYIADFLMDDTYSGGDISEDDLIYWDYDLDNMEESGLGGATTVVPTNGYLIGRATTAQPIDPNNHDPVSSVVAGNGSKYVRVHKLAMDALTKSGTTPWG